MLSDILRFEWRYHTRQLSFFAGAALYFFFGFTLTATGFGPSNVNINAPYSIVQSVAVLSLMAVFIVAVFCANAVVRDRETQMEEIVFTTSVGKLPFLLGRFSGSFLAALTAFSTSAIGMLIGQFMPWHEADRIGATQPLHYLYALLVIALPNILFAAALLFALSTITRSVMASYAGAVLLYALYWVAAALTNSPLMAASTPGAQQNAWLAALLDPFALSAFYEQTRDWTADLRNARLVGLRGNFLLNRILWLGASLGVLAIVYRVFAFRVMRGSRKPPAMDSAGEVEPVPYRAIDPRPSTITSYCAATKLELRSFLATLPFLAMMLLWIGLVASELVADISGGEYGAAFHPSSGLLFGSLRPMMVIATILLVYLSAEIVWRERTLRFSGILHATPTSNAVFVLAKYTALAATVGAITLAGLATIAAVQIWRGWPVDPLQLLKFAWFLAAPPLVFAMIALFVQTITPHKYLGMLLVAFIAILGQMASGIGLEHLLVRFGDAPAIYHSDMNGFGRAAQFHWYVLYWGALGALLLSFAIALWRHTRLRGAPRAAWVFLVLMLGSGSFIFYNTNILNFYTTAEESTQWRADYERAYKILAAQPQPHIDGIRTAVDLRPDSMQFRVRGEYTLVNGTSRPIASVTLGVRRDASSTAITSPAAARVAHDARFHHYRVEFREPLLPGARVPVQFDIAYGSSGFPNEEGEPAVVGNGSFLMSHRAFPTVGYRRSYEIQDARERRRRGLPPTTTGLASREFLQHDEIPSTDWIAFDATISTAADQTAIAPGALMRSWRENGRRFFHYHSDSRIPNQFAISSGRYAISRGRHQGVSIEIYYHPGHAQNVAAMRAAAASSLRYFAANFGPYRHSHLRMVEVPSQFRSFAGFAEPGVTFFAENRGFLIDRRDAERVDLLHRRVAHEVAHQWWGHTLVAAPGPGATMLTETLAKYSEIVALEQEHGKEQVRQLLTYELDRYLSGRTEESDREPPLAQAAGQSYLYYRKGAIVMNAIRDLLGETKLNGALRALLLAHGGADRRPTTAHLLEQLHAVATPEQRVLIDRWMNEVVLYDFTLLSIESRQRADGRYDVMLAVQASMPAAEAIDAGIYDANGDPLYLGKRTLRPGRQTIAFTVARAPASAAIDPGVLRIDSNRFDNAREVQ